MKSSWKAPLPAVILGIMMTGFAAPTPGSEPEEEESPVYQAITVARDYLEDESFYLREDPWMGTLLPKTGRAVRLQLFKRNHYRFFLGVTPSKLPPKAKVHLRLLNEDNEEVAAMTGEPGATAVSLEFENRLKSGLYLVLMGVEAPPGPLAEEEIPVALFYGWK